MPHSNLSKTTASCKGQAKSDKYFSLGNLSELCGIEENIFFVTSLLDKYERSFSGTSHRDAAWHRFHEMLERIRAKQNDAKLNLSIVGEFSTGKSTFINALLRQKLLVSSPIQGTTLASTIIEQGNEFALEIDFLDRKRIIKEPFGNAMDLRTRLDELTTEETLARRLRAVRVILPTECFCPDVRIIDTPGTNAIEAWHEEVTIRTLQEQSDISVVLVTADRLVTNTVLDFVKSHLRPVLSQCVFVVTHIDNVETESERKRQLDYIKKKIKSELELEDPLVLPYASTHILSDLRQTRIASPDATRLVNTSLENEKLLRQHMVRMRLIVQAKSLMHLIDDLYRELTDHINRLSEEQHEKLLLLTQTQKADFLTFITEQKRQLSREFAREIEGVEDLAEDEMESQCRSVKDSLLKGLNSQETLDALKDHLENEVRPQFNNAITQITDVAKPFYLSMRTRLRNMLQRFYASFVAEYKHRGLIELKIPTANLSYPKIEIVSANDLSGSFNYVVEQLSTENWTIGGGAAAGAAIGTAIFPGVGTVLGALAGLIGGAALSPDITQVRQTCSEKMSSEMESSFNEIRRRMQLAIKGYGKSISDMLQSEIDRYYKSYKVAVSNLVREERQKIETVEKNLSNLQCDAKVISERSKRLATVGKKLDEMSKGKLK